MEERRRFIRIKWPFVVQYKTLEEPYIEDQIVGKDISESGASFIVYDRLTGGTKLDLEIQIPFDSMPIFAKGKVVWIKKVGQLHEKAFEVGVIFTKIDPRDEKRFKMYISNEIKARKKASD
tara:strand:+ start:334 stop:696 length:363 start_codon:yes stop_codon:yes gene_type:complete